jgi:hypothetical protein
METFDIKLRYAFPFPIDSFYFLCVNLIIPVLAYWLLLNIAYLDHFEWSCVIFSDSLVFILHKDKNEETESNAKRKNKKERKSASEVPSTIL